ncbi:unnamed protein product [Heterobilharzia americana]|nr:unnamed protein product [Heterobilharzia americana]
MCGLEALEELKKLAEDDSKYVALIKDATTLQGLVLLLSNKSTSVVSLVLTVLKLIAFRPGGKAALQSLIGLNEQLTGLVRPASCDNKEKLSPISRDAEELLSLFSPLRTEDSSQAGAVKCQAEKPPSSFRPKNVILQLKGLTSEDDIEIVCSKLLKVRGVVSITFQLHKHRVLVCTIPSLDPECLVRAVSSVNYSGQSDGARKTDSMHPAITAQIVKKKRRVQSLCRHSSFNGLKYKQNVRNSEMPPYLEDDADLFEVDETRAAPKLRSSPTELDSSKGPLDWLSNFLEKSLFW